VNPEIKTELIRRLRSGEVGQCRGRLRNSSDCYCFNGVLCDVSGVGYWTEIEGDDGWRQWAYRAPGQNGEVTHTTTPPESVLQKAGIDWPTARKLEGLNDEKRMTFEEIADYIEGSNDFRPPPRDPE
jgi:hypothetical protein